MFYAFLFINWDFDNRVSQTYQCHFPTVFTYFTSASHVGNFKLFQTLLLIFTGSDSVISDLDVILCHCFEMPLTVPIYPYKTVNLVYVVCVLNGPLTGHSPHLSHLPGPPIYRHWNEPTNNSLQSPLSERPSNGRKRHISLILNQKVSDLVWKPHGKLRWTKR